MPELWSYTTDERDGTYVVRLSGELDMSGADDLSTVLVSLDDRPAVTAVQVDLGEVRFLDSSGMRAMLTGYHAAQRAGRTFALVGAHGGVRKVLEMAGLLPLLDGRQPPA